MVQELAHQEDQMRPYYEFWAQFDEQFFDEKPIRSPETLPIDLEPYAKFLKLDEEKKEYEGPVARRWRLAKEISAAALPQIKSVCDLANDGNADEHKCPSPIVCALVDSESPHGERVPGLAAALLLPRNRDGSFYASGGTASARLVAAKAAAPYYVAYHWVTS